MGNEEELAKLVRALRESGVDVGNCSIFPDGVFFDTQRSAMIFAEKHDKELVRIEGHVSGWLAKNKSSN